MRDAPMQHWAKHAPKATDPGSDGVTEHDWGVGLKLSHHTGADPARASLWGEMAADLRRTPEYGERYVGELVSLVESHTMSERELMDVVDRRLNQDESAGNTPLRQVRRFWRASALPEENNTKK